MKKDILVRTQVLLEPEQLKALTQLAEEQGKSVSALLREWVSAGLHSQRQKKLAEAALLLSEAYYSDGDLVGYSKLDGEDFFMQGQG
jgi:predicted DNA-binding protein